MYRIAVIENETELQRYGHANVLRNLTKAINKYSTESKYYKFYSYTSANINQLLSMDGSLTAFDAIFISTNACSDEVVYKYLINNSDLIINFIENGCGIYIGYQKKLNESLTNIHSVDEFQNLVSDSKKISPFVFLPQSYRYRLLEEYALEESEDKASSVFRTKDSWEGDIFVEDKSRMESVLLYPNAIFNSNSILKRCRKNEFSNHLYKSSIYAPSGSFKTLLYDNSPDDSRKRVLLAKAIARKNERIVISSMALDWENHDELLANIIEYIAKGSPKHAFIAGTKDEKNSDFNYLVNSAIISKTPCALYKNTAEISSTMQTIHDVYFFSPTVLENDVIAFWNKLKKQTGSKKIYHLLSHESQDDELVLKQYSNSSSLDVLKNRAQIWLDAYFANSNKGFWDGFWVTYDVLLMMRAADMEYDHYLNRVYDEMVKHRKTNGSYDNLIGCTIGMLFLLYIFWSDKESEIKETQDWIISKIFPTNSTATEVMPISDYEKESFLLSFYELSLLPQKNNYDIIDFNTKRFTDLIEQTYKNIVVPQSNGLNCTEIELCRHLQFCLYFKKPYDEILSAIMQKRDAEGKWIGIGRTSGVLISLLSVLNRDEIIDKNLNKKCEESINYILSQFNSVNGSWNDLVLDTARSIHALALYDKLFSLTTKDFFETVQHETVLIDYNNLLDNSFKLSTNLQQRIYELEHVKRANETSINQLKDNVVKLEKDNESNRMLYEKHWRISTAIAVFSSLIAVCLLIFIIFNLSAGLKLVTEVGSLIGLTVSLVLSFVVQEFLKRKIYTKPSTKKSDKKVRIKNRKNKKDGK